LFLRYLIVFFPYIFQIADGGHFKTPALTVLRAFSKCLSAAAAFAFFNRPCFALEHKPRFSKGFLQLLDPMREFSGEFTWGQGP
jgi:hypothetical protein